MRALPCCSWAKHTFHNDESSNSLIFAVGILQYPFCLLLLASMRYCLILLHTYCLKSFNRSALVFFLDFTLPIFWLIIFLVHLELIFSFLAWLFNIRSWLVLAYFFFKSRQFSVFYFFHSIASRPWTLVHFQNQILQIKKAISSIHIIIKLFAIFLLKV